MTLSNLILYYWALCYFLFAVFIFTNWKYFWKKYDVYLVFGFVLCPIMVVYTVVEDLIKFVKGIKNFLKK